MTLGLGGWLRGGGCAIFCDVKNKRRDGHGVWVGTQVRGGAYRWLSEHGKQAAVRPGLRWGCPRQETQIWHQGRTVG